MTDSLKSSFLVTRAHVHNPRPHHSIGPPSQGSWGDTGAVSTGATRKARGLVDLQRSQGSPWDSSRLPPKSSPSLGESRQRRWQCKTAACNVVHVLNATLPIQLPAAAGLALTWARPGYDGHLGHELVGPRSFPFLQTK